MFCGYHSILSFFVFFISCPCTYTLIENLKLKLYCMIGGYCYHGTYALKISQTSAKLGINIGVVPFQCKGIWCSEMGNILYDECVW